MCDGASINTITRHTHIDDDIVNNIKSDTAIVLLP